MPHRYCYDGTNVLRNLRGLTDQNKLEKAERTLSNECGAQTLTGFTADVDGLKAIHKHLFHLIYEWAGVMRGEAVTLEGNTFTPGVHARSKNGVDFAPSSVCVQDLPGQLFRLRVQLDNAFATGVMTKTLWSEFTAKQIGYINYAHPFMEGNGRSMRRFIEESAALYGLKIRCFEISKADWRAHTAKAMNPAQTGSLASTLDKWSEVHLS